MGNFFPLGLVEQSPAKRWKVMCQLMNIDFQCASDYDENVCLDALHTGQGGIRLVWGNGKSLQTNLVSNFPQAKKRSYAFRQERGLSGHL